MNNTCRLTDVRGVGGRADGGGAWGGGGVPKSMDAVHCPGHVLSVVNVCRLRIKDLQQTGKMYLTCIYISIIYNVSNDFNLPCTHSYFIHLD